MSYCRFGEADVYVYRSERGIECCACSLAPEGEVAEYTFDEAGMIAHLERHRAAGHDVPEDVFYRLRAAT